MLNKIVDIIVTKLIVPLVLVLSTASFAQFQTNYQPLVCTGKVPLNLLLSGKQKLATEKLDQHDKTLISYAVETNFMIDRLMRSGVILYNDTVSNYLNAIAQSLLQPSESSLKSKVHIYTLRSSQVNAFATQRGDIFVTLGLLAQLKSSSELAFILSHEISHVVLNHNLHAHLFIDSINRKSIRKGNESKNSYTENSVLNQCFFQKEQESSADSAGFYRYVKAAYPTSNISGVFDVLSKAHLPFSNNDIQFSIFESPIYSIPKPVSSFSSQPIKAVDEYKGDSLATHPNIGTRRELIQRLILSSGNAASTPPTLSNFEYIKNCAQFELCHQYILDGHYPHAIYVSLVKLIENPENIYLKKCLAKSLYMLCKYSSSNTEFDFKYKEVEGNLQKVYFLLDTLSLIDLNTMSMGYITNLAKQYTSDNELKWRYRDMYYMFSKNQNTLAKDSLANQILRLTGASNESIKTIIAEDDKDFRTMVRRYQDLIILNPGFVSFDNRKGRKNIEYLKSEQGQANLKFNLSSVAKRAKVKSHILDVNQLKATETNIFNEVRQLSDWVREGFNMDTSGTIVLSNQEEVMNIAKKYQARYVLIPGVISVHEFNYYPGLIPISLLVWPTTPVVIAASFKPKYSMLYYTLLLDLSTGKKQIVDLGYFTRKQNNTVFKSNFYASLLKVRKKLK